MEVIVLDCQSHQGITVNFFILDRMFHLNVLCFLREWHGLLIVFKLECSILSIKTIEPIRAKLDRKSVV